MLAASATLACHSTRSARLWNWSASKASPQSNAVLAKPVAHLQCKLWRSRQGPSVCRCIQPGYMVARLEGQLSRIVSAAALSLLRFRVPLARPVSANGTAGSNPSIERVAHSHRETSPYLHPQRTPMTIFFRQCHPAALKIISHRTIRLCSGGGRVSYESQKAYMPPPSAAAPGSASATSSSRSAGSKWCRSR